MTIQKSRKYFGTDGIRGEVGESLVNPEFVLKLGWAAGMALGKGDDGKVLIGKDTRISGYLLESALEAGLSAAGVDIKLLGPMPTPAVAYLTRTFRALAGIVISASHNPYQDNGIKFFATDGTKLPDQVEMEIESYLSQPMKMVSVSKLGKASRLADANGRYIEFCKSTLGFNRNLAGLKIVLDCAHGATYRVAPAIFRELDAEVLAIGIEPNGLNINQNSGSIHPELLSEMVRKEKADLGIAFDGDGDRVIMVDQNGEVIDGDQLLFIMAKNYQSEKKLKGGIIGTEMSNLGLELSLQKLGIPFKRTKVGDRYVLQALKENNWLLGGESSGHIVNLGLTTTGDGIISALQVLNALFDQGKTLTELKKEMIKFPQALINVKVKDPSLSAKSQLVAQAVKKIKDKFGEKIRVLLRASGTEPLVRVMVEGEDPTVIKNLAEELANVVQKT
jgi:phosphoglucosamine mutase